MTKIFCVGFQKTGTTSMEAALQVLGYRVGSSFGHSYSLPELRENLAEIGISKAQKVDAVQDMPWPLIYKQLDQTFPGSKFILTTREEDAWWNSILGHFGDKTHILQQLTYGDDAGAPLGHEAHYRQTYRLHNEDVRKYFADRPQDLLELNFSKPVGWEPICEFLELTVPESPFPRANQPMQSPTFRRYIRRKSLSLRNILLRNG